MPHRRSDLIGSLNEVATAIASRQSVDEVLDTVVDSAKRVTDTDKAALCLFDELLGEGAEPTVAAVRGSRDEFPESWWSSEVFRAGRAAMAGGRPIVERHKGQDAWLLVSPVKMGDHPIGILAAINMGSRGFSEDQVSFIAILSTFAASAIENARLAEESRYVLLASERDRIAREMHDGVAQSLFGISLGLELAKKQVHRDPLATARRLDELQEQLSLSQAELRRYIYDLRPLKLQELGLAGAIEYWIHEVNAGNGLRGRLRVEGERQELSANIESCLYRVAKEAVGNVAKHASAAGFEVLIRYGDTEVSLEVRDDGRGFLSEEAFEASEQGATLGMKSIRDRVEAEGGELTVISAPGHGTVVRVTVPA